MEEWRKEAVEVGGGGTFWGSLSQVWDGGRRGSRCCVSLVRYFLINGLNECDSNEKPLALEQPC